jgi:hypothetical protein
MIKLLLVSAMSVFVASASAQVNAGKLNELLGNGWEAFSGQALVSFDFVTTAGQPDHTSAISIFLRKKNGLAYCVRSINQVYEFCQILKGAE